MIELLRRRLRDQNERGVTLVFMSLIMVGMIGMVALSVDIGRLALTRRQLQNATDAATLAAIRELPGSVTTAKADAVKWAERNGVAAAETSVQITSTDMTNDTVKVTARRTVPTTFARVLGISSNAVTTSAQARLYMVVGANTTAAGIYPYTVWAGNKGGLSDITAGKRVTYRSNDYRGANVTTTVPPCTKNYKNNCNWNVQSNTFKGYFHWRDGFVYLDPSTKQVQDQGGNAIGNEPVDELIANQLAGTPVWLPIVTYTDDAGTDLHMIIVSFACVLLDPIDTSGSSDWTGVIQDPAVNSGCKKSAGLYTGPGTAPSIMPQFTTKLVE